MNQPDMNLVRRFQNSLTGPQTAVRGRRRPPGAIDRRSLRDAAVADPEGFVHWSRGKAMTDEQIRNQAQEIGVPERAINRYLAGETLDPSLRPKASADVIKAYRQELQNVRTHHPSVPVGTRIRMAIDNLGGQRFEQQLQKALQKS